MNNLNTHIAPPVRYGASTATPRHRDTATPRHRDTEN